MITRDEALHLALLAWRDTERCRVVTLSDLERLAQAAYQRGLEDAAKVCCDSESGLWKVYRHGDGALKKGRGSEYVQGAADHSALLAEAIRALKGKQ